MKLRLTTNRGTTNLGAARPIARLALTLSVLLAAWAAPAAAGLPIEHWSTASGARVYFVRAPSIPMLDLSLTFDAGGRFDPPQRVGLASLTNSMLAKGLPGMDEAAIAAAFAAVGAQRAGGAGDDRAAVTLRTLSSADELETAVALIERVVSEPTFPERVFAREKERVSQSLREAQTKPDVIARRAFGASLYPGHPYGWYATPETIAAISRDDLVAFYRANYAASRAVVAMIGDVSRAQAEAIATRLTARLPAGAPPPAVPEVAAVKGGERRVAHPASQSHILIGAPGIAWGDPDQFALVVGNYVLGGGGFVSRLYDEVREKRGLAYSVYSYFSPSLQPGPFTVGLQTQREQTEVALGVTRETLGRFIASGPTEQELAAAKANLIGGFALRIDSNRKILDNLATIGFYRLPLDYLDRYPERVEAVTVAQVRDAFARRLKPDSLVTVVVGAGAGQPK